LLEAYLHRSLIAVVVLLRRPFGSLFSSFLSVLGLPPCAPLWSVPLPNAFLPPVLYPLSILTHSLRDSSLPVPDPIFALPFPSFTAFPLVAYASKVASPLAPPPFGKIVSSTYELIHWTYFSSSLILISFLGHAPPGSPFNPSFFFYSPTDPPERYVFSFSIFFFSFPPFGGRVNPSPQQRRRHTVNCDFLHSPPQRSRPLSPPLSVGLIAQTSPSSRRAPL